MMLTAQAAINRYQRNAALGWVVRMLLFMAGIASVAVLPFVIQGFESAFGLSLVFGVWLYLSFTSAKNSRILAPSPELIARGEFEAAEQQIDQAMRAFSLSRSSKLLGLHHLAVLRHKQRQFQDAVALCRAVIGKVSPTSTAAMPGMDRSTRLMLADALLELNDSRGAADAIAPLRSTPLGLAEQLSLLVVELDTQSRTGAWDAMLVGLPNKVQVAELMPPESSSRVQGLLALAASKRGLVEWSEWLRKRAELLTDVGKLTADRPILREVWQLPLIA